MIRAVIFDLDGVLVHTDRLHYAAWKGLTDRLGLPFDQTTYHRLRGISRMDSLEIVLEPSAVTYTPAEKEALAAEKNAAYVAQVAHMTPTDVDPDTRAALEALRARKIPLAVGSSSKNARPILERTDLTRYFSVIVDGNAITRAKPDPEVFLTAARLLAVSPGEALVVEDAAAGIRAAHAGGFPSAAFGGDAVDSPLATHIIARMTDLLALVP